VNLRSRILQIFGFTAVLAATPLAAVYYQAPMRDPDIWWHLRVGESILHGGGFPHTAVFSRFAATNSWAAYSWLFEIIVSQLHRWFSLQSLPTFLFVFQISIGALLLWAATDVSGSAIRGTLLTTLALAACFYTLSPRPVLFTVLFFIVELAIIFRDLRERCIHALYWLPAIFFIWANCHIQFVNGLLVLALLCCCEFTQHLVAANFSKASPDLPFTKLLLIFAGCVLATLINPYTWHLYAVVWGYVHTAAQWDQIVELTAVSFRRPAHYVELLLACSAAFALGIVRTRSLFRVCLVIFAAVVSFHASRDAWMISIVAVFICGEALARRSSVAPLPRVRVASIGVSALLALAVSVLAQAKVGYSTNALIGELDKMYPVRAASFIAKDHPPGPMYNSVNWGGYVIYNLREYPVAADGRTDAYGGDIGAAQAVVQGFPSWKQDPTFATSNLVLIERNLPLARLLSADPDFTLIYQDHLAMVFVRKPR
jgi:hypothetical protein